jgi:hypothetical protein
MAASLNFEMVIHILPYDAGGMPDATAGKARFVDKTYAIRA